MTKKVLITGASSGIGHATAVELKKAGYEVYATARRTDRMDDLQALGIHTLALDVTDDASMKAAVKKIGTIDVLINNAGYGSYGALEDISIEEARNQFEVNVFGLARLTQLVIPGMRRAKQGTIINISSIGGRFGESFGTWYHASKYAVEGLSESLALELAPYNIHVVAVEPGIIKSEWAHIASDNLIKVSSKGAYKNAAARKAEALKRTYRNRIMSPPETVAKGIRRILEKEKPALRYPIGGGARPLMFLRKHLGDKLFYRLLGKSL